MAEPHGVPDWLDRRSAEWCADLCNRVAARLLRYNDARGVHGADACAAAIRQSLVIAKPALPVPVPERVSSDA